MRKKRHTAGVRGTTRTSIEVLLTETVKPLGEQGDIVRVKPGYARNYLLPQGVATIATEHNKQMVERHREQVAAIEADRIKQYRERASAIARYSVTLEANANDDGHLYGSIVEIDISGALRAAGYQVESDQIKLEGPLRELGMYTVKIELHPEVNTEVKVWVVPTVSA